MKRILIVDDSSFMRHAITSILVRHGYTIVGEAENGQIAFNKYKELSPDIVTMDVIMNEMGGLEALKKINDFDENAKVVMVSSMGQLSIIDEAISLGAKGFLIKPFKEEAVLSALSNL